MDPVKDALLFFGPPALVLAVGLFGVFLGMGYLQKIGDWFTSLLDRRPIVEVDMSAVPPSRQDEMLTAGNRLMTLVWNKYCFIDDLDLSLGITGMMQLDQSYSVSKVDILFDDVRYEKREERMKDVKKKLAAGSISLNTARKMCGLPPHKHFYRYVGPSGVLMTWRCKCGEYYDIRRQSWYFGNPNTEAGKLIDQASYYRAASEKVHESLWGRAESYTRTIAGTTYTYPTFRDLVLHEKNLIDRGFIAIELSYYHGNHILRREEVRKLIGD